MAGVKPIKATVSAYEITLTPEEAAYVAAFVGRGFPERTAKAVGLPEGVFSEVYTSLHDQLVEDGFGTLYDNISHEIKRTM